MIKQEKKQVNYLEILTSLEPLEVYEYLVDLAKKLPKMDKKLYTEKYKIKGCSSRAWLWVTQKDQKINILADSDSLIVKGMLAILVDLYLDESVDEAKTFKLELFEKVDFASFLTANRRTGVDAILKDLQSQITFL